MSAAGVPESWSGNRPRSSRRGLVATALVFLAVVWTTALLGFSLAEGLLAWDVRFAYLPAADALVDGRSPYPELDDPILEEQKGYVYPPQIVLALVPLTPLPVDVVAVLTAVALLGLVGLTLWLLGVRDARCYAAAFLWMPTASGVLLANVSIPLAFALAVAWRYRDRVWPPAVSLGLAVSAKLVLWPMLVWTVLTGRGRATLWAVVVGAGTTLAAWAAIGFDGFREYPDLLRRLSEIQSENSYSFVGMAETLGLGQTAGRVAIVVVGVLLLVWCAIFARRRDDVRSFTCAVAATLALSPIVWLHYLVVLLVPVAISRPRFSFVWLVPIFLWMSPRPGYAEGFVTFLPALGAALVLALVLSRPQRPALTTEAAA